MPEAGEGSAGVRAGANGHCRPKLHFMIIGAQKSGTTSLHRYLERHPQLYMLPEKEVPFFTNDDYFRKGWKWYSEIFFHDAPLGKHWGKATPHYMTRLDAPHRIFKEMPSIKLIALLRNPVERAFSHYRMMVKLGVESRSFIEVVEEKLEDGKAQSERLFPPGTPENGYLVMGEYGLILQEYFKTFPKDQLLVLFTEDLKKDPAGVLRRAMDFLGLDSRFMPDNLKKLYHVGGTKRRVPMTEKDIANHRLFRKILRLMPRRFRSTFERRFLFWYMIWNTKPEPGAQLPQEARERLVEFYREDVAKLERLIGQPVPWPEFASLERSQPRL